MNKKIFAISTLVLVLLVGAIFVYNFAFKKPPVQTAEPKTADEGKTNAISAKTPDTAKTNDAITAISDESVFGAVLAPDTNYIYYFSGENGQLNQVDLNGKLEKVVSTEEFQNIESTLWNKPRNKAIIKRSGSSEKSPPKADQPLADKFLLLDLAQKSVTPFKDNIDSIAWSGLGDKVIYKYYDSKTKTRTVDVADPNGANWRKIADINSFGISISPVPGSSDISFWPTPDAFVSSSVSSTNFSGGDKKEILADRWGADLLWSPNGKTAAVSYTDQKGGKKTDLALMNSDGGQFQSLEFPDLREKMRLVG